MSDQKKGADTSRRKFLKAAAAGAAVGAVGAPAIVSSNKPITLKMQTSWCIKHLARLC